MVTYYWVGRNFLTDISKPNRVYQNFLLANSLGSTGANDVRRNLVGAFRRIETLGFHHWNFCGETWRSEHNRIMGRTNGICYVYIYILYVYIDLCLEPK